MKVNTKVRIRSKSFWMTLVPAVLLMIQSVAAIFGYTLDMTGLNEQVLVLINVAFGLLAILGIVNDPTTEGFEDSDQAMSYDNPRPANENGEGQE